MKNEEPIYAGDLPKEAVTGLGKFVLDLVGKNKQLESERAELIAALEKNKKIIDKNGLTISELLGEVDGLKDLLERVHKECNSATYHFGVSAETEKLIRRLISKHKAQ